MSATEERAEGHSAVGSPAWEALLMLYPVLRTMHTVPAYLLFLMFLAHWEQFCFTR